MEARLEAADEAAVRREFTAKSLAEEERAAQISEQVPEFPFLECLRFFLARLAGRGEAGGGGAVHGRAGGPLGEWWGT